MKGQRRDLDGLPRQGTLDIPGEKICTCPRCPKAGQLQPEEDFYWDYTKGKRRSWCKVCYKREYGWDKDPGRLADGIPGE